MKKGDIRKWIDIEGCKNMLFFSQLVNELLFDYSIPSNRISTLNSHYLVLDAMSAIQSIERRGVPEGTLKPIIEELYCELDKDVIFENKEPLDYFLKLQGGNTPQIAKPQDLNYNDGKKCVQAINSVFFDNNKYFELLKDSIIENVKSNKSEEQQKLFRLTKSLLTELMNSGYSLKYIYVVMEKLFWNPEQVIDSTDRIDDFFAFFDYEMKKYTIVFKVKWLKMNPFISHLEGMDFSDSLPEDIAEKIDKRFINKKSDEKFIVLEKSDFDPYSAAETAISMIEDNTAVYRLYNHSYRYDIKTADYRSLDEEKAYKKGKSIQAVEHIRMPKEEQIVDSINLAAESIMGLAMNGYYGDFKSIMNAVKYHAHSLDSSAEENQLLDLWAIFESVLDISNKHTSDRIIQICDYLVPILKHKYLYSLFNQLAEDIRSYDITWYGEFVESCKDKNEIQSIAEFVLLDEYKSCREDFYAKCDEFPLLKERIVYYNKILTSKQNVYSYVEKHANRVLWQVMRIYRNRNLIIHNADKMPYLKLLIENLHSYVDEFINYVIYASSQNKDISSMCQELFVKECKWNRAFKKGKDALTTEDIELMLSI